MSSPASDSSARTAARFWDRMARRYAAASMRDPAGYEKTLERVREWLSPQHEVLEIGCGTGSTALRLAPAVGRLLATDVSPQMIAIARQRHQAQPTPGLEFAIMDTDTALSEAAAWDRVLAFNVLHLLDDLDATLAAVAHTLRPGGLLISKTPCLAELNPLITRLLIPLLRAVGLAPSFRLFDGPRLQAAIERSGLEPVAVERHGSGRKDARVFIVARKPAVAQHGGE